MALFLWHNEIPQGIKWHPGLAAHALLNYIWIYQRENNSQRQTDLEADRKMRRSQYAFRIFDKETRSAVCLFAHILGKVKYLLALLALTHTSRDTLSGAKRETAFTGPFLRPVVGTEQQRGSWRTLYSFQAQCCLVYRKTTPAIRKGARKGGLD